MTQIQSAVVLFYGQYDSEESPPEESEAAPADAESIAAAIDASGDGSSAGDLPASEAPEIFENIETGVLERDLARHETALLDQIEEGEVLDLGRVEGLSAAPSTLRGIAGSDEAAELAESDTMEKSSN